MESERWPSGDRIHLAVIRMSLDDLSHRMGLAPIEGCDDLGSYHVISIQTFRGRVEVEYRPESPDPSGYGLVLCDSEADATDMLEAFLKKVGMGEEDLTWISTRVDRERLDDAFVYPSRRRKLTPEDRRENYIDNLNSVIDGLDWFWHVVDADTAHDPPYATDDLIAYVTEVRDYFLSQLATTDKD
jgi:hypothetical protein